MKNASLWEFSLAALTLWFIMSYVPKGIYIGLAILLLAFIETGPVVDSVSRFLNFLQTGQGAPSSGTVTPANPFGFPLNVIPIH